MTDFSHDIDNCLRVLAEGGIILYPTDTLWGLGCDATNGQAVQKIIDLKGKVENQGLIILLASERDVLKFVTQPDLSIFDYLNRAAKPTTVIYEGGTGVAENVLAADGSIAIRLVKEEFCKHLLKRLRKPLVSTSANMHGEPSPQNFSGISDEIKKQVDYVVHHRQNDNNNSSASAIIKWKNNAQPQIIRP